MDKLELVKPSPWYVVSNNTNLLQSGTPSNVGVNGRSLQYLFNVVSERSSTHRYSISAQIIEIYNEQLRDMLAADPSASKVELHQNLAGIYCSGVETVPVKSPEDVEKLMTIASKNRTQFETQMNTCSSRSHLLVCISVNGEEISTNAHFTGKLYLVDLAGSERVSKSGVTGDRLKELQSINKSLSALGNVMNGLLEKKSHIPYRDSKLTHLLKEALGIIICCLGF
jgi:kinesin family protein C2/C3